MAVEGGLEKRDNTTVVLDESKLAVSKLFISSIQLTKYMSV